MASARTLDILRGHEGTAAAIHYRLFQSSVPGQFGFRTRQHHPPPDPVNALLSLGYTLLFNNMLAAIQVAGLDPYRGCYHQPQHGHACLASDLIEEFRAVIVDSLVAMMLNHKELALQDFTMRDKNCALSQPALQKFLERYDQRIRTDALYPPLNKRFAYRQMFELQARQFARLVMDKEKTYQPYRWRW